MTTNTAEHRPAQAPRGRTHDTIVALDMFSGCGGSSEGIEAAGIDVWYAANHWEYAVSTHEANHPQAEHFIADLVDTSAKDYYHPEHLPSADVLWASPSCTNHSKANAKRAYAKNVSPLVFDDESYDDDVTSSERSRATAVCVLQYARKHHPKVIAVENVVEFCQWGNQVPGQRKGDGSTFRWWLNELRKLGYRHSILFLNSMFFGVPQSRDRVYIALWDEKLRTPNLDFTPIAHCLFCDQVVEAQQTFKKRTKAWPMPQWGKYGEQYIYTCPSCDARVEPAHAAAYQAIDWTDLGQRIGDRDKPMAPNTMARIQRGVDKFFNADAALAFQCVLAGNTFEHPGSSCRTRPITDVLPTQHTTAADGFVLNYQGIARGTWEALPTQAGKETMAFVTPALAEGRGPNPRTVDEALPTQSTRQEMMLVNPPFMVKNNGGAEPECRSYPVTEPMGSFTSTAVTQGVVTPPGMVAAGIHVQRGTKHADGSLREARIEPITDPLSTFAAGGNHQFLMSIFAKQNGGPADTAWHQAAVDPLQTATSVDSTCLVTPEVLPTVDVDDCHYRMLKPAEIQAGMGIRPDFIMTGTARNRVKALGNAVTPPVATEIMLRLTEVLR